MPSPCAAYHPFPQAVLDAARHSMGMDISDIDLLNVHTFAERVIHLAEYRLSLQVIATDDY